MFGKQSKQCLHEKNKNWNMETFAEREIKKSQKMIALALFVY